MATRTGPQASAIFLCERVLQDMVSPEAVTCVNIYNGLMAVQFPIVVPVVYAFAQITGVKEQFDYEFKLVDDGDNVIASSGRATVTPQGLADEHTAHKVISAFHHLGFESEGVFTIVLALNGVEAGSLPLKVVQVQEPVMAGQAQ